MPNAAMMEPSVVEVDIELALYESRPSYVDYNVLGHKTLKRVCVPKNMDRGEIFNAYHLDGRKNGVLWLGTVEKSLEACHFLGVRRVNVKN